MELSLLELPVEIILLILSHLPTPSSRAAVAQTCRSLNGAVEELLYAFVELWSEKEFNAYFQALMAQKTRLGWTKYYALRYRAFTNSDGPTCGLRLTSYMPNLQSLVVQLPENEEPRYLARSNMVAMVCDVQRIFQERIDAVELGSRLGKSRSLRGPMPHLKSCEFSYYYLMLCDRPFSQHPSTTNH